MEALDRLPSGDNSSSGEDTAQARHRAAAAASGAPSPELRRAQQAQPHSLEELHQLLQEVQQQQQQQGGYQPPGQRLPDQEHLLLQQRQQQRQLVQQQRQLVQLQEQELQLLRGQLQGQLLQQEPADAGGSSLALQPQLTWNPAALPGARSCAFCPPSPLLFPPHPQQGTYLFGVCPLIRDAPPRRAQPVGAPRRFKPFTTRGRRVRCAGEAARCWAARPAAGRGFRHNRLH